MNQRNGNNKNISVYRATNPFQTITSGLERAFSDAIRSSAANGDGKDRYSQVLLFIRKGSEQFYIDFSCNSRDNLDFTTSQDKPQYIKPSLFSDEFDKSELSRSMKIFKEEYLPVMLASLKNKGTMSAEAIAKFKNGRFNWITVKYEIAYDKKSPSTNNSEGGYL